MPRFFDTHAAVKRLMLAGMPEKQAEVIVQVIFESRGYYVRDVATEADPIKTEESNNESLK